MGDPRPANILGICGAPCTGKTTLANWLTTELASQGVDCVLLPELARILAAKGVKIDSEMGPRDYDAFLAAYLERDTHQGNRLAIADRTLVDHYSYLAVNKNIPDEFIDRHREAVIESAATYKLLLYLPIDLPMKADGFRETSLEYQRQLDREIQQMLKLVAPAAKLIAGPRKKRQFLALEAVRSIWPEILNPQQTSVSSK